MNRFSLALLLAVATVAASAQTTSKPATPATPAPKSASASTAAAHTASTPEPWIKLPPGVPVVAHGPVKTIPITVHYEDIKAGTGAEGESGKLWHLKYTGWRAADGVKFDSWDEHAQPVMGKDGKQELGPDGKPKMADPEPMAVPQGIGAVIPGFDYGLAGMKIGGKRRIFIPWQLAYGMRAIPDRLGHAGIPAKSDLIFDVELVDVTDMPAPRPAAMPAQNPRVPPTVPPVHLGAGSPTQPGASAQPSAAPAQQSKPAQPAAPAASTTAAPAAAPAQTQAK